ncbi:MAG: hypothetical protein NTY65_05090 [Planctomycetota bacterium]|nr:hypothetical protein [Planctomycetota bacterium]
MPPLALILSVVGLFLDGRKVYAIIGTVIAGLTVLALGALLAIGFFVLGGKLG